MYLLGIDIGTGGSRAVAIDANGRVAASANAEHEPFASPHIGWAEQDPADWWRAACESIRGVLAAGIKADAIAGVSFSGQMHGSVFLDATDKVVRPALLWCDQRTVDQCREITEKVGRERIIELVYNPAITGFTLPKLIWLREVEPEAWKRVSTVLLPKDYVRLRLTGDKASDVADSSGTLLFDVGNRRWSDEMLDAMEIDRSMVPEVFESIERTGSVSAEGSAETGLAVGTPVFAGAGDNAAGAIGMGIAAPGMVSATIGTSGVIFAVTEQPKLDLKGRTHTLCHAVPSRWHMTGVTLGAGLSLKWFRDNLGGGRSFVELGEEAAAIAPGSDGLLWLPYLMGERTPHLDPDARAAFIGLTASHTRGHMARAVMEGVAFSLRDSLEIFRSLGVEVDRIRLGGGGSHSSVWRQIQADVYGIASETIEADEGAAFGAAILAGVGTGVWPSVDEACRLANRTQHTIEPNDDASRVLNDSYSRYVKAYPALKNVGL